MRLALNFIIFAIVWCCSDCLSGSPDCLPVTCHSYRAINKPDYFFPSTPPPLAWSIVCYALSLQLPFPSTSTPTAVALFRFIFMGLFLCTSALGILFCSLAQPSHLLTENTFSCVKCMTSEADTDGEASN